MLGFVIRNARIIDRSAISVNVSEGTRRVYRIDPDGLAAMRAWLDQQWARALVGFGEFVATAAAREGKSKE